jgi:hypothetical protein
MEDQKGEPGKSGNQSQQDGTRETENHQETNRTTDNQQESNNSSENQENINTNNIGKKTWWSFYGLCSHPNQTYCVIEKTCVC